ncbi:TetR/AcrR family transcriptional regulator [Mycetocola reblochoni]|uniref:TetR/AcrR family transcriptional regulator n=1 Tax=Mycetocola reblochoni TaxID=331618 RepID=A0A3L6ZMN8_9MICO|nr:TetR/AcrR family transcriptional regulator [Mycetocola reblochoni]RLP69286.1 TetR/AcrR family transcriptional regulator [Mycetocola reblochoni]
MSNSTDGARLSPAQRRAQIVEIASSHFSRDGIAGASMSAIAAEAGVTRALVYHYFPGKESLLEAVLEREADRVLLATAPDPALSQSENVERSLLAFFERFSSSSGGVRELYAPSSARASMTEGLAAANHVVQLDRLVSASGAEDTPANRLALGAWLAFVEYAARTSVTSPAVSRAELLRLCTTALESILGHPLSTAPPPTDHTHHRHIGDTP